MARTWILWAAAAALAATAAAQRSRAAAAAVAAAATLTAALMLRRGTERGTSPKTFARYPAQYVARRATVTPIDGDLEKAVWKSAPWSAKFTDIRGPDAPPGAKPSPWQATKVKMLWDDEFLYIGAVLDVDAGDEIVAKFKERNSPIFHTDSDFEVFLDPAGCCHGYKELEINALNTVWNLLLDKPYADGGGEFSGRVAAQGEPRHWDTRAQKTAVKVTKGQIGNPTRPSQWCCEIALAHSDSLPNAPCRAALPVVGACWRINFSRVEKQGNVNWVWSPQVVWTPSQRRYAGQVNMHLPDAWGYVVFADEDGNFTDGAPAKDFRDSTWPARHAAACVYYACKEFREKTGNYPDSWAALEEFDQGRLLRGASLAGAFVGFALTRGDTFTATVSAAGRSVQINEKRLLSVI